MARKNFGSPLLACPASLLHTQQHRFCNQFATHLHVLIILQWTTPTHSSKDMTLSNPFKSTFLTPFCISLSLILIANCSAVRSAPLTLFRGLEYNRNREDPLKSGLAPTEYKYFTTVGKPRAAAIISGYNSLPVLDVKQCPTSPDAALRLSVWDTVKVVPIPTSALGTLGLAPCSSTNNFMHLRMTPSLTYRARTTSTRNVPPVRTRRLIAIGSYSLSNFFSRENDRGLLDECACSVSSSRALSLRDKSRLYECIYLSFGVAGFRRPDLRGEDDSPFRALLEVRSVKIVAWAVRQC